MGIGYLVTRLCQDPLQGQGGAFLRLAEFPPEELVDLILSSLNQYGSGSPARNGRSGREPWGSAPGQNCWDFLKILVLTLADLTPECGF